MSDIVPGTLVKMQTMRRYSHYIVGDVIAVPLDQARDLDARRLARPLAIMVPMVVEAAEVEAVPQVPLRQPAGIVRK